MFQLKRFRLRDKIRDIVAVLSFSQFRKTKLHLLPLFFVMSEPGDLLLQRCQSLGVCIHIPHTFVEILLPGPGNTGIDPPEDSVHIQIIPRNIIQPVLLFCLLPQDPDLFK